MVDESLLVMGVSVAALGLFFFFFCGVCKLTSFLNQVLFGGLMQGY
jgi:hypothetical protein